MWLLPWLLSLSKGRSLLLLLLLPLGSPHAQAPGLPSPEDKNHEPGAYIGGAPNWWSKLYLPQDSGGTSKVPMPDGLMIAQSQALRTSHKDVPWDNAETLTTPDGEWPAQEKIPFKPGTDEEYLKAEKARRAGEEDAPTFDPENPDGEETNAKEKEKAREAEKQEADKELLSTSAAAYGGGDPLPGSAAETAAWPSFLRRRRRRRRR